MTRGCNSQHIAYICILWSLLGVMTRRHDSWSCRNPMRQYYSHYSLHMTRYPGCNHLCKFFATLCQGFCFKRFCYFVSLYTIRRQRFYSLQLSGTLWPRSLSVTLHVNYVRLRRHRTSSTNCVEFPWSQSRRLNSHAAVEFLLRRHRRNLFTVFRRNHWKTQLI